MPQATAELSVRWDEEKAWAQLGSRFGDRAGVLYPKKGTLPTEDDYSAIDYLIQEWDYGYMDADPDTGAPA